MPSHQLWDGFFNYKFKDLLKYQSETTGFKRPVTTKKIKI